MQQFS
jgi:hypothetical protein